MLRRWEDLPDFMQIPEVKPYWEILWRKRRQLIYKRIFDFIIGTIFLFILTIPMAVIAVMIKLDSPGSVFYRQERITSYGEHFPYDGFEC